jgi:hypothetical protein
LAPSDRYFGAWVELRRRRRRDWGIVLLGLPLIVAMLPLWSVLRLPAPLFLVFGGVWFVAIAAVHWWRVRWPCPRCGRAFYKLWWLYWPLASRYLHCDLPEYAPDAEG